jgi:hypothetical protein
MDHKTKDFDATFDEQYMQLQNLIHTIPENIAVLIMEKREHLARLIESNVSKFDILRYMAILQGFIEGLETTHKGNFEK